MSVVPHWFLPANGDSRADLGLGNDPAATKREQSVPGIPAVRGQRRTSAPHGGRADALEVSRTATVDWKYHLAGSYLLNDALPPNHGQL
jgi:hypothetical protein